MTRVTQLQCTQINTLDMNTKLQNRRKFHRVELDGQVDLEFTSKSYKHCLVKNLSLTGMFVVGNFQQQRSEICYINFSHKTRSGKMQFRALGETVWFNGRGAGLKFTSMIFDSYMSLLTTLINKAEHPKIILTEFPKSYPFEVYDLC